MSDPFYEYLRALEQANPGLTQRQILEAAGRQFMRTPPQGIVGMNETWPNTLDYTPVDRPANRQPDFAGNEVDVRHTAHGFGGAGYDTGLLGMYNQSMETMLGDLGTGSWDAPQVRGNILSYAVTNQLNKAAERGEKITVSDAYLRAVDALQSPMSSDERLIKEMYDRGDPGWVDMIKDTVQSSRFGYNVKDDWTVQDVIDSDWEQIKENIRKDKVEGVPVGDDYGYLVASNEDGIYDFAPDYDPINTGTHNKTFLDRASDLYDQYGDYALAGIGGAIRDGLPGAAAGIGAEYLRQSVNDFTGDSAVGSGVSAGLLSLASGGDAGDAAKSAGVAYGQSKAMDTLASKIPASAVPVAGGLLSAGASLIGGGSSSDAVRSGITGTISAVNPAVGLLFSAADSIIGGNFAAKKRPSYIPGYFVDQHGRKVSSPDIMQYNVNRGFYSPVAGWAGSEQDQMTRAYRDYLDERAKYLNSLDLTPRERAWAAYNEGMNAYGFIPRMTEEEDWRRGGFVNDPRGHARTAPVRTRAPLDFDSQFMVENSNIPTDDLYEYGNKIRDDISRKRGDVMKKAGITPAKMVLNGKIVDRPSGNDKKSVLLPAGSSKKYANLIGKVMTGEIDESALRGVNPRSEKINIEALSSANENWWS